MADDQGELYTLAMRFMNDDQRGTLMHEFRQMLKTPGITDFQALVAAQRAVGSGSSETTTKATQPGPNPPEPAQIAITPAPTEDRLPTPNVHQQSSCPPGVLRPSGAKAAPVDVAVKQTSVKKETALDARRTFPTRGQGSPATSVKKRQASPETLDDLESDEDEIVVLEAPPASFGRNQAAPRDKKEDNKDASQTGPRPSNYWTEKKKIADARLKLVCKLAETFDFEGEGFSAFKTAACDASRAQNVRPSEVDIAFKGYNQASQFMWAYNLQLKAMSPRYRAWGPAGGRKRGRKGPGDDGGLEVGAM